MNGELNPPPLQPAWRCLPYLEARRRRGRGREGGVRSLPPAAEPAVFMLEKLGQNKSSRDDVFITYLENCSTPPHRHMTHDTHRHKSRERRDTWGGPSGHSHPGRSGAHPESYRGGLGWACLIHTYIVGGPGGGRREDVTGPGRDVLLCTPPVNKHLALARVWFGRCLLPANREWESAFLDLIVTYTRRDRPHRGDLRSPAPLLGCSVCVSCAPQ